MGVDVVMVRAENRGTSPRRRKVVPVADVPDRDDVFVRLVERVRGRSRAPMLGRVDPYGTLVLTCSEMPQLLQELAYLAGLAVDEAEARMIDRVAEIARACAGDPASELRLDGD
ncbi:hypothetical protein GCM10010517_61810 [Streptosporangium fragile]|uniref:Uncharacterized protein n=1 Tax=Streptosporangium fragile TaxID=46186 RepID=A0ABP6IN52_9ACTN